MVEPLALALHPIVPVRTPRGGRDTTLYGYHLRLTGGPGLAVDDPVLHAFAASVETLGDGDADEHAMQSGTFDPGNHLALVREGIDDDGDEVVGVWDLEEQRRAGTLAYTVAARVAAANDHGLDIRAFVLSEIRTRADDRRSGFALFVYPADLVTVDIAAGGPLQRPETRARPRLVLIADEGGGLRWWDSSASTGPIDLDDLPVSADLAEELRALGTAFESSQREQSDESDFMDEMERGWQGYVLDKRTRSLWDRVRRELGRRYAVGLMLDGMSRPAWSPEELSDEDGDDDIPF